MNGSVRAGFGAGAVPGGLRAAALVLMVGALAGCTGFWQTMAGGAPREGVSSSLVDYLYPDGGEPPAFDGTVPTLRLPLRVGLAFVPTPYARDDALPEAFKARLLEAVRTRFASEDYVREIQVVPDTYLQGRRGFTGLDQVARLYGLDVIALVSYDQVAIADDRTSSLLYWTIVGAYLVKGSANDVSTFVDTAVFDVPTRKLLLRAPGVNELTATSTLVGAPERMREARQQSFEAAMVAMTDNLADELKRFERRIKEDRSVLVTDSRPGGGAGGVELLGLLAVLVAFAWWRGRR